MSDTHHFATALPRALPTGESRDLILYSRFGKRVLDICIAILLLPVLVPLIGLLIGLVKLEGGGWIVSTQTGRAQWKAV